MFDFDSITMIGIQPSMHLLIHISHRCKCWRRDHGVKLLRCMDDGNCCCAFIIIRCLSHLWDTDASYRLLVICPDQLEDIGLAHVSVREHWKATAGLQDMKLGTQLQTEEIIHYITPEQCHTAILLLETRRQHETVGRVAWTWGRGSNRRMEKITQ
jgi:hypothetical protein